MIIPSKPFYDTTQHDTRMKVLIFSTLLLAGVSQYAHAQSITETDEFEDCVDCLEDIDDARDCLRECNEVEFIDRDGNVDGSLLANCLDPSRSGSEVESLDELVDCCDFDRDCENDLEDVQDCLSGCLDSCISDFAEDYLECIQDEAGSRDCDLGECIDGFLNDLRIFFYLAKRFVVIRSNTTKK
jgi:hypothetical protein